MPTGSFGQRWRDRISVTNPRQYLASFLRIASRTFIRGRHDNEQSVGRGRLATLAAAVLMAFGILASAASAMEPAGNNTPAASDRAVTRDDADRGSKDRASRRDRSESRTEAKRAKPAPPKAKPKHKPKPKSKAQSKPKRSWVPPTSNFRISSGYGARWGTQHKGLDFAAPMGTKIVAANPGVVSLARWHNGYGKAVVISHGHGVRTLYGHSSKLLVKPGQHVKAGQPIALVGSTGQSTGPHLHFEVHHNNHAVDPRPWLAQRGVRL